MEQMPSKNRLISGKKIFIAVIAFFVILISFTCIMVMMTLRSGRREYTSFGTREAAIIKNDMGITIDENVTPVRLLFTHGGGDYAYQLWVQDIDSPEKFMADRFEGSYELVTDEKNVRSIEMLSYEDGGSAEGAKIYDCKLTVDGYDKFDYYYMAFYPDGKGYKAKIYGTKT